MRNHPESDGTSALSPYLHFGNISPLTIALAVLRAERAGKILSKTSERFLEQLIGWRELAVLFVRHEPNYDNWECAVPWARKTLLEHASDPRPYRYTLEQLERAEAHDDLWNAAQRQMVATGWMHNTMRMYWAKKILEWAPDPATAFDWAVILNDRYELDGHDPNGYAGIAWAVVGKFDRPWFNRPVFGLVRSMTSCILSPANSMLRPTFANSANQSYARKRRLADSAPSCIRHHNWRQSQLSYNGPHSHSRKLRVSLSVIRWISRSSPLEDFQNRGSRKAILETRDESHVRSEMQRPLAEEQCRESSRVGTTSNNPWPVGRRSIGRVPPCAHPGRTC